MSAAHATPASSGQSAAEALAANIAKAAGYLKRFRDQPTHAGFLQ